jgi:hypothetical protein
MNVRAASFALACLLLGGAPAFAQDSMEQGEARINVRSDVKLGVQGTGGTKAAHLQQLADAAGELMPDIRGCYAEMVKKQPSIVGTFAVRVTLTDEGAKPKVEIKQKRGDHPPLGACIQKVVRNGSYRDVGLPAAAILTIDFDNTRAEGHQKMEAIAKDDRVSTQAEGDGFAAQWREPDGRLGFRVTGKSEAAVERVTAALRDSFAGFLDCRRRAQKNESPEGNTQVMVRTQRKGELKADVRSTTVKLEKRVLPCVGRAFKRMKPTGAPAGQRLIVDIRFDD